MRHTWTFHSAGEVIFGRGAVDALAGVVGRLNGRRLLIITDPALIRAGLLDRVRAPLASPELTVEVFDGGEPEPSLGTADTAVGAARAFDPDVIIGLGGGSNIDLAKITAAALTWGRAARDYIGDNALPGPVRPLVCVPTTAGTGSEVSGAAVLTDAAANVKVASLSQYLRPRAAVIDPLLTVSCPPRVTADSGIDALSHAIEAYTAVDNAAYPLPPGEQSGSQGKNPLADVFAERAIELVGKYVRRAVADGTDLDAREGMALAATLGGLAFSNAAVGAVHALEYPLGALTHCSHGAGNGLLLPAVMRFNLPVRRAQFAAIARLLGEDLRGAGEAEAATRAVDAVDRLRQDLGIPGRLRDLGVSAGQIPALAAKAYNIRRILRASPRPVDVTDFEQILTSVL